MRHDKITKKVEQIEKVSNSDQKIVDSITEVIKKFDVNSVFIRVDTIKRCGVLISTLGMALTNYHLLVKPRYHHYLKAV